MAYFWKFLAHKMQNIIFYARMHAVLPNRGVKGILVDSKTLLSLWLVNHDMIILRLSITQLKESLST